MSLKERRGSVRSKDVDMTEGSILRHIVLFSIPLLLGNLFQQLYNMVDTWVVGNFVSDAAYSAVGNVGPIVNMFIGFFGGLSSGAGVVISQFYGARRYDDVHKSVHTAMVMTLVLGIVFTGLGILLVPLMLKLINMPDSIAAEASTYLTIYFAGIMGLLLYNIGSGILRAVGDSKRPFYYLAVCALTNVVLDLVFVIVFGMGVEGVALATVISQLISAILVVITLLRTDSCVKFAIRKLAVDWAILKKIFLVGIPAALQLTVTAFSNVFVQSYINFFQGDVMGGWTSYSKIDQLLFLPMQSIALAATTFVGQNLGKCQEKRAEKGVHAALALGVGCTLVIMVPVMVFAPELVGFFNHNPQVVHYGALFLRWLTPFYVLCCFNQIYAGALRGAGNSRAPMVIMISCFVFFRQLYLFIMSRVCNEVIPIAMAYPAGWFVCSLATTIYFYRVKFGKNRLLDTKN